MARQGAAHAANILQALTASPRPLSAYDLLDRLRPTGITAPLTIYRALDRLMRDGKVHRVESLNAFVACRTDAHHHHEGRGHDHAVAFTICDQCGVVNEFADARLCDGSYIQSLCNGFTPRTSTLEVHGLCSACGPKA